MDSNIKFEENGDEITFYKEGWNTVAHIDNISEIVEIVKGNAWRDNNGYLFSSKLKKYLHRLVVEYKIGVAQLENLTKAGFVVDHLNNDEKYNCRLDNLHVISSDLNIAKGHTVDKDIRELWLKAGIGLYWLKNGEYQIGVGFNIPTMLYLNDSVINIDHLYWNFENFDKCYIAIQTIISSLKGQCRLYADRLQSIKWGYRKTVLLPKEYTQSEGPLIKYGDSYLIKINNVPGPNFAVINKPAKVE